MLTTSMPVRNGLSDGADGGGGVGACAQVTTPRSTHARIAARRQDTLRYYPPTPCVEHQRHGLNRSRAADLGPRCSTQASSERSAYKYDGGAGHRTGSRQLLRTPRLFALG